MLISHTGKTFGETFHGFYSTSVTVLDTVLPHPKFHEETSLVSNEPLSFLPQKTTAIILRYQKSRWGNGMLLVQTLHIWQLHLYMCGMRFVKASGQQICKHVYTQLQK